jgi:hypothetical protein
VLTRFIEGHNAGSLLATPSVSVLFLVDVGNWSSLDHARRNEGSMLGAQEDLYWPHDRHLNVKGNRLAGLLISRHLLEQSFLDVSDKSRRLSDIHQQLSRFD